MATTTPLSTNNQDMKKYLILNPHSFVDVITNSSTELFVCDTDKTLKAVKDILMDMVEGHNKMTGEKETFDNMFREPRIYTKEELEEDSGDSWGGWGYEKEENIGSIIIEGVGDNSIPYELFRYIEKMFGYKIERYHLG